MCASRVERGWCVFYCVYVVLCIHETLKLIALLLGSNCFCNSFTFRKVISNACRFLLKSNFAMCDCEGRSSGGLRERVQTVLHVLLTSHSTRGFPYFVCRGRARANLGRVPKHPIEGLTEKWGSYCAFPFFFSLFSRK